MTLAQIYRLALRQLDEDPADIDDFKDLFVVYANQGYQIALRQYYKPKETIALRTDEKGEASIDGLDIVRIISFRDEHGYQIPSEMSEDGTTIRTGRNRAKVTAVCVVTYLELENDSDVPNLPTEAHAAIADYICYKYLSNGNLAKQSRAQMFRTNFYAQMQTMYAHGSGSVTRMRNLYTASDIRRW